MGQKQQRTERTERGPRAIAERRFDRSVADAEPSGDETGEETGEESGLASAGGGESAVVRMTRLCQSLGEPTRLRLLALLEGESELSVAEITEITGLAQPRISTHLQKLRETGLVEVRRAGGQAFYRSGRLDGAAAEVLRATLAGSAGPQRVADAKAKLRVLAARIDGQERGAQRYFPGRSWEGLARGLVSLLRPGRVIDIGCGEGAVGALLAEQAEEVRGVDHDGRLIGLAQARIGRPTNQHFEVGDAHALAHADCSFDLALLLNVLPWSPQPGVMLREAHRVLRPGGRVLVSSLLRHSWAETAAGFGHQNQGQGPEELSQLMKEAGFQRVVLQAPVREARPPHFEVLLATGERGDSSVLSMAVPDPR